MKFCPLLFSKRDLKTKYIVQLITYFQVKEEEINDFKAISIIFDQTNWTKLFREKTLWSLAAKKSN